MRTFPLNALEFIGELPVEEMTFDAPTQHTYSQLGSGIIIPNNAGPSLWQGRVLVMPERHREANRLRALIDLVRPVGRSFMMYDRSINGPKYDPQGTILGSATVLLNSVDTTTMRQISLKGLPANYRLAAGDMISWSYGSNPVRYALHQIVDDVTASGSGVTASFEITPFFREGAAVNDPVKLVRPMCKAMMVPNSFKSGVRRGSFTNGMEFSWIQLLG